MTNASNLTALFTVSFDERDCAHIALTLSAELSELPAHLYDGARWHRPNGGIDELIHEVGGLLHIKYGYIVRRTMA